MPKVGAIRVLWGMYSKYRFHVVVLVVLGSLAAILEGIGINAVIPLLSFFSGSGGPGSFITDAIQKLFSFFSIPFSFRYLLGFILILFFLRAVASAAFGSIRGWITADFSNAETGRLMRATMSSSWSFLLRQKMGVLQNTLVRDVQRASNLLEVIGQVIQSFSGFLMYFLVALNISPRMTLITLGGGAVLLVLMRPFLGRTRNTGEDMIHTEKRFTQFLSEHIIGMKSVKAAGVEDRALQEGNSILQHLRRLSIKMALIRSANTSLFQPFSIVFVIILFAVTYKSPEFSIIAFAATLYLIQKIFTYLESGQSALQSMFELIPYAQHVHQFEEQLSAHHERVVKADTDFSFKKEISFRNVSLLHAEGTTALREVNLTIHKGETIGVIGPSGAGKTSFADVLMRLFEPSQGGVFVDAVPAEHISLEEWRSNIGYVSQEAFLLNQTVEENIRFYRPELTKEDIIEATKRANIYEFIENLPEGFATVTGDRGVMLSGGQRQRIALARALAGRPEVLLLDEATSALDHESEKLIQDSIRSLRGNTTVVIIAHRPSTVADADRIIVLDGGEVSEEGVPDKLLMHSDSYFYKMQHGA